MVSGENKESGENLNIGFPRTNLSVNAWISRDCKESVPSGFYACLKWCVIFNGIKFLFNGSRGLLTFNCFKKPNGTGNVIVYQ
jgi:hypothetical protein